MTALPTTTSPLSLLPALRPAAAKALDVTPRELIERWLAALSPTARRSYARSLRRFAAWALVDDAEPEAALRLLCGLDVGRAGELVRRWRNELLASGLASGSVAGYCTALCSLLAACRRAGLVAWKLDGVLPKVEQRQDRSGPRRGDVERLFAVVDDAAAAGHVKAVRDAALLRLLYCGALRRSEATNLRLVDVDLDNERGPVVWPRRKGAKARAPLGVSERTAAAIAAWMAVRGDEAGALFYRLDRDAGREHLCGESIRHLLAARAREAGVRAACRPHGLRHSAATELARRGSLDELMSLGGWRSLSAASAYLDRRDENRRRALALVDA